MKDFGDHRSTRCVFVAHCLLAQGIRANGVARYDKAAVKTVVQFCLDHDINIMQMPCPELLAKSGGVRRPPHGKKWYEEHGLRETCESIATQQATYMKTLNDNGYTILAVIGVEFSPACATKLLNRGPIVYKDQGIFVEELIRALKANDLRIPILGVGLRWQKKLKRDLESLIGGLSVQG